MTGPSEQPERELCDHYRRQLQQYSLALDVAKRLPHELGEGLANEGSLRRLGSILDDVATAERRIRSVKNTWESRHSPPGAELRNVIKNVAERLQQLIGQIHVSEGIAQNCKDRLQPQIHTQVLSQRMREAYANAVNHV